MQYTYNFLCFLFGWLSRVTDCTTFFNLTGTAEMWENPFLIALKAAILIPFLFIVCLAPIYWILKIWSWMLVEIVNGFDHPACEDDESLFQKIINNFRS